jgi:hypothetical protein
VVGWLEKATPPFAILKVQTESGAKVMPVPLYLTQDHHELTDAVVDCEVDFSNVHLENVVLTASIADGPNRPILAPRRGQTATTLAFRMDQRAAMMLQARLAELGRTMGWLQETTG